MRINNKVKILKTYGVSDIIDKFLNYPKKIMTKKKHRIAIESLKKSIKEHQFPDIKEYEERKDKRVIISVTSFPARFEQLVVTLKSVIIQEIVPDKIIVYLGSDTKENDISTNMRSLEKYGVEYRIDKELNLKGHKKYYYALREFKNNIVITIDDDIIFPKTMIKELIECYEKYPNAVCARRVHKITKKNKKILPYNLWDKEYIRKYKPSNRLIATTGAGTLYSPYVNNHLVATTFEQDKIKELCLEADDIWMKCMEIMSSIKVVLADINIMGVINEVNEEYTLMPDNVGKGMNDIFLNKVIKNYSIDKDLFIKD